MNYRRQLLYTPLLVYWGCIWGCEVPGCGRGSLSDYGTEDAACNTVLCKGRRIQERLRVTRAPLPWRFSGSGVLRILVCTATILLLWRLRSAPTGNMKVFFAHDNR